LMTAGGGGRDVRSSSASTNDMNLDNCQLRTFRVHQHSLRESHVRGHQERLQPPQVRYFVWKPLDIVVQNLDPAWFVLIRTSSSIPSASTPNYLTGRKAGDNLQAYLHLGIRFPIQGADIVSPVNLLVPAELVTAERKGPLLTGSAIIQYSHGMYLKWVADVTVDSQS
jgi:hypothetical protein